MPSSHQHCHDWTRGRETAAGPGAGLPTLEPGMPVPAGTGLTRRSVLMRSAALALAVYGGRALAPQAVEEAAAAAAGEHQVLVSIFMDGGADSLSVLAPTDDARYAAARPTLAVAPGAGTPFAADPRLRWHPAAEGMRQLWDDPAVGVAVAPAIGCSTPNHSHFTMRHFWEVGALDATASTGWLGRYLDVVGVPDVPIQGLSLGGTLNPALAAAHVPTAAAASTTAFNFWAPGVDSAPVRDRMMAGLRTLGSIGADDPQLRSARRAQAATSGLTDDLVAAARAQGTPAGALELYPGTGGDFEQRLKGLAQLLDANGANGAPLPIRVVSVNAHGGWDTHSRQNTAFETNLRTTMQTIRAFWRDLELRGHSHRVVVHLWSEFGRRVQENGSFGTDHGAAGASFVIGERVRQGLVGEFPGLATGAGGGVDAQGNLRATADFRSVYSALLRGHLGADPEAVLPDAARFGGLELFG